MTVMIIYHGYTPIVLCSYTFATAWNCKCSI